MVFIKHHSLKKLIQLQRNVFELDIVSKGLVKKDFWNELDDIRLDIEFVEIDRGHTVLLAQERCELVLLNEPHLCKLEPKASASSSLLFNRLLQLQRRN